MHPRSLLAATALVAGALTCAPAASAAPALVKKTSTAIGAAVLGQPDAACANPETSKPFRAWADLADYVAIPSGSFEAGLDEWSTRGDVELVDENEPWHVGGADHSTAAALRDGASLTSARFCGGLEYPTIRLFARSQARAGALLVTVHYTGRDRLVHALPLGIVPVGREWAPTTITPTASGLPLLTGTGLGVTVTSLAGDVVVDDLYVDPYRRS